MTDQQYRVKYHCTNCGANTEPIFEAGVLAPATTTCVICGCATAKKLMDGWNRPS